MTDETIIAGIRRGDETIMDYVMNKYAKLLWTIASDVLKSVGAVQDVEECVADVFIYLWQNPGKFDPRRGRLKTWLCVICRTRAIDRFRSLSAKATAPLDDATWVEQLGLAEGLIETETRQVLLMAVEALPEPEREILIRRYYYDQKPRQIARAMHLSVKQVDNRLYRTKQKLRDTITREEV